MMFGALSLELLQAPKAHYETLIKNLNCIKTNNAYINSFVNNHEKSKYMIPRDLIISNYVRACPKTSQKSFQKYFSRQSQDLFIKVTNEEPMIINIHLFINI